MTNLSHSNPKQIAWPVEFKRELSFQPYVLDTCPKSAVFFFFSSFIFLIGGFHRYNAGYVHINSRSEHAQTPARFISSTNPYHIAAQVMSAARQALFGR